MRNLLLLSDLIEGFFNYSGPQCRTTRSIVKTALASCSVELLVELQERKLRNKEMELSSKACLLLVQDKEALKEELGEKKQRSEYLTTGTTLVWRDLLKECGDAWRERVELPSK